MTRTERHKLAEEIRPLVPAELIAERGVEILYKTPCICAVLSYFGISKDDFDYAQTDQDLLQILNEFGWETEEWDFSGRVSQLTFNDPGLFVTFVKDHVLLTSEKGVEIDTLGLNGSKRRKVHQLFKVSRKKKK